MMVPFLFMMKNTSNLVGDHTPPFSWTGHISTFFFNKINIPRLVRLINTIYKKWGTDACNVPLSALM